MLIVDEGFGCLDRENFTRVAKILSKLKSNFRCMLIITHIDELKSYADRLIDINHDSKGSKISYCENDDSYYVKAMLKMRILDCMKTESDEKEKVRKEENDKRKAAKALAEKKKKEKLDKKEAEKKRKRDEKQRIKDEKQRIKDEKQRIKREADAIMTSVDRIKGYILEEFKNGDEDVFKCKACSEEASSVTFTSSAMFNRHAGATRHKVKHRNYIRTLL
jgi:DNA repair exonuclease SbcCD ATPase subunit